MDRTVDTQSPCFNSAARNDDTVVIVPMYNESLAVGDVVHGLRAAFSHVVAVDDGSLDGSAEEASRAGAVVLRHPYNVGQGAALQTGFEWALSRTSARFFVTFDADGQHRVEDAAAMVNELRTSGRDALLGSRFLLPGSGVPIVKGIALRTAKRLVNASTGAKLTDAHNGLRVLSRRFVESLRLRQPGMAHATEIIGALVQGGFEFREFPVTVVYTEYSIGKGQRLVNGVNILFDTFLGSAGRK